MHLRVFIGIGGKEPPLSQKKDIESLGLAELVNPSSKKHNSDSVVVPHGWFFNLGRYDWMELPLFFLSKGTAFDCRINKENRRKCFVKYFIKN